MKDKEKKTTEQLLQENPYVPLHLKHRPILALENYESSDGNKAGESEAKGLSIGLAQWNAEGHHEVSAKIWRHTGEKWSRQSEEMPLHRVVDLTILIARARLLFKRFQPTDLDKKPGYPLIDQINLQGTELPISACTESETFEGDVEPFQNALSEEEIILKHRFDILTDILTETDKVIAEGVPTAAVSPPPLVPKQPPNSPPTPPDPPRDTTEGGSARWYRKIELKDIILTGIAFISIMTALFFAGQVREFRDLTIGPEDIMISEAEDDTIDLWIRQKNGIQSVMITKQIIDYGTGTGHFACIDPQNLLSEEGEQRLAEGVFLGRDEKGTALVDSTTERHPALGAAYHLKIPREILYQTGDGVYHSMSLYHGSPLTITAFRSDFADYTHPYRINPFTLHAPWWPTDDPYLGTYSLEALSDKVHQEAGLLEAQLRKEFNLYAAHEEEKLTALREEGVQAVSDLEYEISGVDTRLSTYVSEALPYIDALAELKEESAAGDTLLRDEFTRNLQESDSRYEELRKEGFIVATGLEGELRDIEERLSFYARQALPYIDTLTSLEGDVTLIREDMVDIREQESTRIMLVPATEPEAAPPAGQPAETPSPQETITEEPVSEETSPMTPEDILASSGEWRIEQLYSADLFMKEEALKLIQNLYITLDTDMKELRASEEDEIFKNDSSVEEQLASMQKILSRADTYSPEIREDIREDLLILRELTSQVSEEVDQERTAYLNRIDARLPSDGQSQESPNTSRPGIILFDNVQGDLAELLNTVRLYNNLDIFSSIREIDEAAVERAIRAKYEDRDLGQREAVSLLESESYQISSYEMFLIFSVFFNQYYM